MASGGQLPGVLVDSASVYCPTCGSGVNVLLPVEPLYVPEVAASLVPCTVKSLLQNLNRHKHLLPLPYYRVWRRHRYRLISATEIRWLRDHLIRRKAKWPKVPTETPQRAQEAPSDPPSGATGGGSAVEPRLGP